MRKPTNCLIFIKFVKPAAVNAGSQHSLKRIQISFQSSSGLQSAYMKLLVETPLDSESAYQTRTGQTITHQVALNFKLTQYTWSSRLCRLRLKCLQRITYLEGTSTPIHFQAISDLCLAHSESIKSCKWPILTE